MFLRIENKSKEKKGLPQGSEGQGQEGGGPRCPRQPWHMGGQAGLTSGTPLCPGGLGELSRQRLGGRREPTGPRGAGGGPVERKVGVPAGSGQELSGELFSPVKGCRRPPRRPRLSLGGAPGQAGGKEWAGGSRDPLPTKPWTPPSPPPPHPGRARASSPAHCSHQGHQGHRGHSHP